MIILMMQCYTFLSAFYPFVSWSCHFRRSSSSSLFSHSNPLYADYYDFFFSFHFLFVHFLSHKPPVSCRSSICAGSLTQFNAIFLVTVATNVHILAQTLGRRRANVCQSWQSVISLISGCLVQVCNSMAHSRNAGGSGGEGSVQRWLDHNEGKECLCEREGRNPWWMSHRR
jgi:hypothetical protein